MDIYISHYVYISNKGIVLDGRIIYHPDAIKGVDMLVDAYKTLEINYPKFYKMDNLSKLAVLSAEVMLAKTDLNSKYRSEDIALIASTAHSSLDTDLRYWDSVATVPSPSLFVYTLPNVMLGEICIRWKIKGENTCFVSDKFDADFQTTYVNGLLANQDAEVCISGRADYLKGEMEAFFMLVEKNPTSLIHNIETVQKTYERPWKN